MGTYQIQQYYPKAAESNGKENRHEMGTEFEYGLCKGILHPILHLYS